MESAQFHSWSCSADDKAASQRQAERTVTPASLQTPWVRLGRALWHTAITRLGAETPAPRLQRRHLCDRPLVAPAALCLRVNAVTDGDCLQPEASSWRPHGGARGYQRPVSQQDGLDPVQHCCPLLSCHSGNVVCTMSNTVGDGVHRI